MACSAVLHEADGEDNAHVTDLLLDDQASCELMLEALQEHLRSIEERLVEFASDLLPSLTPPPGYSRSDTALGPALNSREEERRRIEEDELRESKEKEKAKLLEIKMHHLKVVADRERQYAVNKRRYIKLLSLHVEQQKLELNKQQKRFEKRRAKEQAKKRTQMLKKKPVRFRTSGDSDYTFLAHLPQTLFYKIVAMETELKKAGKLNTVQDVKEFWDKMLAPPQPTPAVKEHRTSFIPPIEDIIHSEDEDGDDVTNSWAITAAVPTSNRKFPTTRKGIIEHTRFIPTEVPVLKPLSEIFSSDTTTQKKEEEQLKKHKARIELLQAKNRTVNEMYQTARANEVTMRRMLEDSGLLNEEPIKLLPTIQPTQSKTEKSKSLPTQSKISSFPVKRSVKGSKQSLTTTPSSTSSSHSQLNRKGLSEDHEDQQEKRNKPVPLQIEEVEKDVPIKEAKHTSMWKNYTKTLTDK